MLRSIARLWIAAALVGCGEDMSLGGNAPTPFWIDGGDASANSDSAATLGSDAASDTAPGNASTDGGNDSNGRANDASDALDSTVPDDQYFASWLETAQQLQDPSPFGDSWAEQRTTTLGLVKVQWSGTSGWRWQQPCAMHTTTNFNTETLYSASFLGAIPVVEAAMSRQGNQWTQAEELQVVGLKAGYTGLMPDLGESVHPALVDSDKDGQPGVTVFIDNFLLGKQNLQVAQRSKTAWTGAVQPNGEVTAEPKVLTEQTVVAASLSLLVVKNTAKPVEGKPSDTLRWRPIPVPIDCKTLLASPAKYIGRSWPP